MSSPDSADPADADAVGADPADAADAADLSDAALARLVIRALGALIALLVASGLVVVAERADDRAGSGASTQDPALAVPAQGIGPLPGQPVALYVQARTAELSRVPADEERVAVVSFADYVVPADVDVGQVDVEIEALLVAAPGGEPAVIDDRGVRSWAADERRRAADERGELESLLPTVDDPDFERTYREDIARLEALERDVDPQGAVVFGAVVKGTVEELRRLASESTVRLVDVGRDADVPDHDEVTGLRPEETHEAGEPRYRPVAGG